MFKSTAHMKSEMMDRLTEDVGGLNNAYTQSDVTVYYEVVPSNYLETLLWAEADRLSTLNVDEANFKSERSVVEEEFRTRVLAPPYGRLDYLLEQKSFFKHPYRRPTIGSIEELEAASLADVRAFHSTFYRPDNATLVPCSALPTAPSPHCTPLTFGSRKFRLFPAHSSVTGMERDSSLMSSS